MEISNALPELIKSLTQSEKRYFRVYASRHTIGVKNDYLLLFEEINKQKKYNEQYIRERFADKGFIKHFPVVKNYLYNIILKSLHSFHSSNSVNARIDELIHEAYILDKKALYSHEKKLIDKALNIAQTYEQFPRILEILRLKMNLLGMISNVKDYGKELDKIKEIQQDTEKKIDNLWKFMRLKVEHKTLADKYLVARSRKDEDKIDAILSDTLLMNEKRAITFDSKNIFFNIKAVASAKKRQWKKAYGFQKKQIALLESRPELLTENIERYINASANYILTSKTAGMTDEFNTAVKKFKSIFDKYHKYIDGKSRLLMIRALNAELSMYIDNAEFEKGKQAIKEFKSRLRYGENEGNKNETTILYFHTGLLLFITAEYDNAVYWLNKIISDTSPEISRDINCYTRILNLIIHFEMNDMNLLEFTLRSTYMYLSKIQRLYKFEKVILDFLRKSFRVKSNAEFIDLLALLKDSLIKLSRNRYEKKPIKDLFLIEWINSKIEKRSLESILKESAL